MKLIDGAKRFPERVLLWVLRAFLTRYSFVVAKALAQRDERFIALRSAVIQVATDHHARLLKLEQAAQEVH